MNTIKLTYGLEDIKSRVPGLFAYMEFAEDGSCEIHPASDSVDGCYGKIPCSIKLPNTVNGVIGELEIFKPGGEYSYRTLMNYYYEYVDTYPNSSFIQFMDECIGKFKIDADIDYEECTLVPEYEYYANCARLYDEYTKISKTCKNYAEYKAETGEEDCNLECLTEKYNRMGGDTMRDYYKSKINTAIGVANTCYGYVVDNFNLNFDVNITVKANDLGIMNTYIVFWDPDTECNWGDVVVYNDRSYVCKYNGVVGEWDSNNFDLLGEVDVFNTNTCNSTNGIVQIEALTESRLIEFRGMNTYLNEGGNMERPGGNEDWLWYYRKGAVGHYETTNDDLGNIATIGVRNTVNGTIGTNLMAYGDVLTDITRNTVNGTITFEYIMGANLMAQLVGTKEDDIGNKYYCYGDYQYNTHDPHGILQTETYHYDEDSEINNMTDEEFNSFISFGRPKTYNTTNGVIGFIYTKAPFSTQMLTSVSEKVVNGEVKTYSFVLSEYNTTVGVERDTLCSPLTKLDYLTGITYNPNVKSNVNITRGNAAAWERHIKLSEIKTFQDLSTYANGGFFNIR